jgi:hypothetical protein
MVKKTMITSIIIAIKIVRIKKITILLEVNAEIKELITYLDKKP